MCAEYLRAISLPSAKGDEKMSVVGVYFGRTREGWNRVSTHCCSPK